MKIGKTRIKGKKFHASGRATYAETVQSDEFVLEQGVVVAEVKHKGTGEFSLKIVPTEGWSETGATIATTGAGLATGAATGAAIGSIIPGLGTLVGMGIGAISAGFIGGKVSAFVGGKIDDQFRVAKWEHEGKLDDYIVSRVGQDKTSALLSGKHKLEVKTSGRWSVNLIQPELGQASESIISDEIEEPFDEFLEGGHYVLPPMITGNNPVIAKVQHKGRAGFLVYATSVDGTHEVAIFRKEGQFFKGSILTNLIPGKEYILEIFADGEWNVGFSEGY